MIKLMSKRSNNTYNNTHNQYVAILEAVFGRLGAIWGPPGSFSGSLRAPRALCGLDEGSLALSDVFGGCLGGQTCGCRRCETITTSGVCRME